ncbi:MAG: transglycosylase domain-containing protein [Acidimicrobiia bacterium]
MRKPWALPARRRRLRRTVSAAVVARVLGTVAVGAGVVVARRRWRRVAIPPPALEPTPEPERAPAPEARPEPVAAPIARRGPVRRLAVAASTLVVILTVGGLSLGICLAAIIPGARIIATSHSFTADRVRGNLSELSQRTNVYAADGTRIATLGTEDRDPVALEDVPQLAIDAVIATEDKTFYENPGIDVASVVRAFVSNATVGEIEQGGSTITQQLVKNRVFRANRDLDKKVRELVLAYRLNQDFTKDEILEEYLNTVYFGSGSYGFQSAAERFFVTPEPTFGGLRPKRLDELNLSEAALLAAVIANPEGDNPFTNPDRALERRGETLDAMVEAGYITRVEADFAHLAPLPTVPPPTELRPQTYFVEEVQQRLLADPRLGATETERLDQLLRGGLEVSTTLDPVAQLNAQVAVNETLSGPPFTAALVAIEPATGAVRAMVGGPGFEELEYNIVTHEPGRQAGSAWKVITLAAALEAGYSPNDVVDGTSPCTIVNPTYGIYPTVNAEPSSGGVMSVRDATVGSVNCAYARLFSSVGPPQVIEVARRLGLRQDTLRPILSATLGTIEVTPLEMATVGATIAANGVRRDPYFVHKVVAPDGTVLVDETGRPGLPAVSPDVAACATDILRGVVSGGTGTGAQLPGRQVAGKTGTTDNKTDAWFLGFTPQLSATVWHGSPLGAVPGAGFGGEIPATIWRRFMGAQLADQPGAAFRPPGDSCNAPGELVFDWGRIHPLELLALFPPPPAPLPPGLLPPAPFPLAPAPPAVQP